MRVRLVVMREEAPGCGSFTAGLGFVCAFVGLLLVFVGLVYEFIHEFILLSSSTPTTTA